MLIGEYHHNIDDKGRLTIPSKFREELGTNFILTRGLDGCLFIYSLGEWNKVVTKLKELPFTKKDARSFARFFLSGAVECELDRQGRINISAPLIETANIIHECIIIGVNDRLEIWSKERFDEYMLSNSKTISDTADHLFEVDFDAY